MSLPAGGGGSQEAAIADLCADIQRRLPPAFDVDAVCQRYPTTYKESMNTVLAQECIRWVGRGSLLITAQATPSPGPQPSQWHPGLASLHWQGCHRIICLVAVQCRSTQQCAPSPAACPALQVQRAAGRHAPLAGRGAEGAQGPGGHVARAGGADAGAVRQPGAQAGLL